MPVSCRLDHDARIVRIALSGTLSGEEMLGCIDQAARDTGGVPGFRVLSDHRGLDTAATPAQIQAVVLYLGAQGHIFGGCRWAVVTTMPASQGMMAMLQRYVATVGVEVQIFTDPVLAEAWLGPLEESGD